LTEDKLPHTIQGMEGKNIWIVIAAYNESESIAEVLNAFSDFPYQIVVVDDGSSDDTCTEVLRFPVVLLQHITNLGQGAALQTGIDYILQEENCDCIVTFDADGQHKPDEVKKLIAPILNQEVDIVLGSRFIKSGSTVSMPFARRIMLKMAIWFTQITTRLPLTDTHNGLRAFSIFAAQEIRITANRMAHASQILSQISKKNIRYKEIPVNIHYTKYSLSKGQSIMEFVNILWEIMTGGVR
jgi:polyprenyl-phospho-N-acetylgalactosaminyl synthase